MTTTEHAIDPSSIVVAADGSDDADRAIDWAAAQAFLERRPLVVLTAVGIAGVPAVTWAGMGAAYAYQPDDLLTHGRAIADAGRDRAEHLHPGLAVTTAVQVGDPRQVLVDLSRQVHLVVMGSRGRGLFRSKVLGSVSASVSRDAACPVVVCRPGTEDRAAGAGAGILVGADGTPESLPVLEHAFRLASLRDLPLTVMHCVWEQPGPTEEHRLLLAESIAGIRSAYPEVAVELRLASGLAEEALAADSARWDAVVVGRHPVDTLLRLVTGAVATTVVERARTTVAVVPQADPPC
ncbi:universal stress protein [Pimelobacter simplex]|uniref:Universal stress protein n=1 Tax=Nocardioides simplex TaxID=2045 RepID=A0A7J5DXV3_NOCSI|nr:universal stress protein [Pimelobacter simplex]KAB2810810.1 universal stress protein [Pimelobacter simplex]